MKALWQKHKTVIIISIGLIAIIALIRYAKKKAATADSLNPISSGGSGGGSPFSVPPEEIETVESPVERRRVIDDQANRNIQTERERANRIATKNKRKYKRRAGGYLNNNEANRGN